MRICLITYATPHLKTQQILHHLLHRGNCSELGFLVAPFNSRKPREVLFEHRPNQFVGPSALELATGHDLEIFEFAEWRRAAERFDTFLVCGAGLLPAEFVSETKVINAHPGLLYQARGLDAFKWAILDGLEVGISLHHVDAGVDAGPLLATLPTPVYPGDSIETLAQRHYESEIDVLAHFDRYLSGNNVKIYPRAEPHMRMPAGIEKKMLAAFPDYVKAFARV